MHDPETHHIAIAIYVAMYECLYGDQNVSTLILLKLVCVSYACTLSAIYKNLEL